MKNANSQAPATDRWWTVLFSADLSNTSKRNAIVMSPMGSDSNSTYWTEASVTYDTYSNTNHNYGSSAHDTKVGERWNGDIAFFYFTDEYIDFSEPENAFKFVDVTGYPLDLGSDGSNPTGTAPLLYFRHDDLTDLKTNLGVGGDFTNGSSVVPGRDVNAYDSPH